MELKNFYQETDCVNYKDTFVNGTFCMILPCLISAQDINHATPRKNKIPIDANIQSKSWEGELREFGSFGYSSESLPVNKLTLDPLENYTPKTELGKVLLEVRAKIKATGIPFLTMDEVDDLVGRKRDFD